MSEVYDETCEAHAHRADLRLRLPARGLAARPPHRDDPDLVERFEAVVAAPRAGQRLLGAQRPGRPARALRGRGGGQGGRRRGGRGRRRRLHPGARVRAAADRRARDRHRPAGDADRRRAGDPRGHPLPGDAAGGGAGARATKTRAGLRARCRPRPTLAPPAADGAAAANATAGGAADRDGEAPADPRGGRIPLARERPVRSRG